MSTSEEILQALHQVGAEVGHGITGATAAKGKRSRQSVALGVQDEIV